MKRVFVCAGAHPAKDERIMKQARDLGYMLAELDNVEYVQGGCATGVMGATLETFIEKSDNYYIVIPKAWHDSDMPKIVEMLDGKEFKGKIVKNEAERLNIVTHCDYIIVLPGGTGTLEELLYCNETARASEHDVLIEVVNIGGFYNGFLKQLKTNVKLGLSKPSAFKFKKVKNISELSIFNLED